MSQGNRITRAGNAHVTTHTRYSIKVRHSNYPQKKNKKAKAQQWLHGPTQNVATQDSLPISLWLSVLAGQRFLILSPLSSFYCE